MSVSFFGTLISELNEIVTAKVSTSPLIGDRGQTRGLKPANRDIDGRLQTKKYCLTLLSLPPDSAALVQQHKQLAKT